jgi:hypothetical protein
MNKVIFILLIMFVGASTPRLHGQINPPEVDIRLTSGQMFYDTISSTYPPNISQIEPQQILQVLHTPIGSQNKHAIKISLLPGVDYKGKATVTFQYTTGTFPPQPRWSVYNIDIQSSVIQAKTDFHRHNGESEIVIIPLQNDETTADSLWISGIAQVQNGTVILAGDSIRFTPASEEDAYIIYSVRDDENTSAQGKIVIAYERENETGQDTLRFTLLNTRTQTIILPALGFNISSTPVKGNIIQLGEYAFEYIPSKNALGGDAAVFEHDNGSVIRVEFTLRASTQNTSSVRDDVVYTPRNQNVTFNVFDNDLSRNFPINQFSAGLTYLGNGNFSYTPPAGFIGIKNFTYRVNYGTYTSAGKIAVHVDNYYPKQDIEYRFTTPKNVPVAVQYDMPINGYSFESVVNPLFGTVTVHDQGEEVEAGCNTLLSKSMFIYTPDANYYGTDEFQIRYCIANDQCVIYKIYITVADETRDTLCHCVGKNCVWAGDFDNDGFVTVKDLLSLGRFLGLTGTTREEIAYNYWYGQNASDWGISQPNGQDIKYIDANGDGLLNETDQAAIENHYLQVHNVIPEPVLSIKDYPFQLIPNQTELDSGDLLVLTISIGNAAFPVLDLHGLAFGLQINPEIMDSSSFAGTFFKNSWFTYANPSLQMIQHPQTGNIQAAFTRSGGSGVSGRGPIGQISFIVIDEHDGFKGNGFSKNISSRIWAEGIIFEDENGERVQVPDTYTDITIKKDNGPAQPTEDKLIVFPNPTSDWVYIHFNGRNTIYGYTLIDALGRVVVNNPSYKEQSLTLQTSDLVEGTYVLKVTSSAGVITKKFQVVRQH